jgi:hypothetical protein
MRSGKLSGMNNTSPNSEVDACSIRVTTTSGLVTSGWPRSFAPTYRGAVRYRDLRIDDALPFDLGGQTEWEPIVSIQTK